MAEVLKEWLTERLRRPINWDAEQFGDMMKNGHIIASVLLSYNVINDEKYYLIRSDNVSDDIKNNWKYLREWLQNLEVNLSDADISSVMEGKGTALLRLFYQLFLHLDKRDRTDFIKREQKMVSTLVEKMANRFTVEKIPEEKESFIDSLSKPLLDEKQFIDWQRKKSEQVKETYDFIRHKYLKMLSKIKEANTSVQYEKQKPQEVIKDNRKGMEEFALRYPCKFKSFTYEELLELEEKAAQRKKSIVDSEWVKNYMNDLHSRMRRKSDSTEFQKQIRNVISSSLWDVTLAEEESKLDKELAKNVMKLSQIEKQMCTKIMETKQQARNLVSNRVQAQKEFAEQREQQFGQFFDNVREQIHLEVTEIDFEKQRQNMLHRKLYAEKIKRKRQHYYEICYDTVLSIVDYATKFAYFTRLMGGDIPDSFINEWKNLYFKQQPIFDILDPMENILIEVDSEDVIVPEEEEIIRLELDRQDVLNDSEFTEYHNFSHLWTLDVLIPNYDPESEEKKIEYLGTRILGHVVYTLLDIKYPYPPLRPPADLPEYSAKALLRGLPDRSIAVAMQTLLSMRKIHVVRLEPAINFCLKRFKTEMVGCKDVELNYDKLIAAANNDEEKELIKTMKYEDDCINRANENPAVPIPPNTKQTQTPKTIPEENIVLSDAANLGRYAYESMNFGKAMTDYLLAAIIVEYLKDQDGIKGFVIINYPNSYSQAKILEETFSGIAPPEEAFIDDTDDIYLEESIGKRKENNADEFKEIRVSKLVDDPHKKRTEKPFESYFTCYIHLKETEDILQELVIWDLTRENSELIDRFYAILGMNYSMYYETIDKDCLSQICQYIIGDNMVPLKSCDKLFGENVLSLLDFPSSNSKRTKSKIVKPDVFNGKSKEIFRQISKASKMSLADELSVVKAHESNEDITVNNSVIQEDVGEEHESKVSSMTDEFKVLPGEEEWDYGNIPIPPIICIALATCWEEIEKAYINDMKSLFFAKRLQMNSLVPYARFIKDKMDQIITLPSQKQDLVCHFQREYNNFENDWRNTHLTKNEWHCRVKELQNKLYPICDERKMFAQQQRHALICENWTMEELTTMANTYISCMQTELNRSILTFQTMHDFYFGMIKHMPPTDRLLSKDLTKISRETDDASVSKKSGEDKVFKQLKAAFLELQLKNIDVDFSNNPFNLIIENNAKFATKFVTEINSSYRTLISREYSEIAKIIPPTKKKDENTSEESMLAEEIFKENALKCIDEWIMGINGEMFRACLRIQALQYKCYRDMKLFNDHIYKTFMEVQNDINTYYMNEINSVDRLCKYLQMAVEEGRKIPESLILEHDTFVIDPNLIQYAPLSTPVDSSVIKEIVLDTEFRIGQLAKLRSSFKIVAPTGIALLQGFIYMLQDFVFFGKESCDGPMIPDAWKCIDPEQIPTLAYLIFGESAYVDWRDFLIYCLNIRFPTVDELLDLRKRFRCGDLASAELISRDDFILEELWFEQESDYADKHSKLRRNLTKHFLFELFEIAPNKMNYSAFLLAFCKNVDPIEGFVSALSMAIGNKICFVTEECMEVVCKLIKEKKYKDECRACALKCTNQLLDIVITTVINICEGTSIVEMGSVEPPPDSDKKGKKKKMKKSENTLSARSPKSQKSITAAKSKIAHSDTDVKSTFICAPCEESDKVEEKTLDKEEIEEEVKIELEEDANLVYAVSQAVIWNVLRICLPWHFELLPVEKETPFVNEVTNVLKVLESDTDTGDIYICKFVSQPYIYELIHKVKKFSALNFAEEIRKIFF